MDQQRLARCRQRLQETAIAGALITYSEMAAHLGIANQAVGTFLNAIYLEETAANRPDITLLVVYRGTDYGRYNSHGERSQSIRIFPTDKEQCKRYDAHVKLMHKHWSSSDSPA